MIAAQLAAGETQVGSAAMGLGEGDGQVMVCARAGL